MSRIFEIFGYRLSDNSTEANESRRKAWCPFMGKECDGGGNRYSTQISLADHNHQQLSALYPERTTIIPGVCSLIIEEFQSPWIVCPRRLLFLGKENSKQIHYQDLVKKNLLRLLDFEAGTRLGAWSEVKVEYAEKQDGVSSRFDYTFDYILMPLVEIDISLLAAQLKTEDEQGLRKQLIKSGYRIEKNTVFDFPFGKPVVIEIMTSSTSGQNKSKGTTIGQAFENALLGKAHIGPGINYRQVWSRMAGQLFVKSEVGLGWGGITIWILQDLLANYISATTRLDLRRFLTDKLDDINILTFGYDGNQQDSSEGVIKLARSELFSGEIDKSDIPSMTDIMRISIQPPYGKLIQTLLTKGSPERSVLIP